MSHRRESHRRGSHRRGSHGRERQPSHPRHLQLTQHHLRQRRHQTSPTRHGTAETRTAVSRTTPPRQYPAQLLHGSIPHNSSPYRQYPAQLLTFNFYMHLLQPRAHTYLHGMKGSSRQFFCFCALDGGLDEWPPRHGLGLLTSRLQHLVHLLLDHLGNKATERLD